MSQNGFYVGQQGYQVSSSQYTSNQTSTQQTYAQYNQPSVQYTQVQPAQHSTAPPVSTYNYNESYGTGYTQHVNPAQQYNQQYTQQYTPPTGTNYGQAPPRGRGRGRGRGGGGRGGHNHYQGNGLIWL